MARGSNASQGRSARSSINDILPAPPSPNPNYKPEKSSFDFDYKKVLENAKTTEADWERNIEYQKNGAWEGKMTGNIKKALEEMEKERKAEGRVARSEAGGSRQDSYWANIEKAKDDQSAKDATGREGDEVRSGNRSDEVSKLGLVEKKKYIMNAAKEEVDKGNLTGDLRTIGRDVKIGGTTERFAGGYAVNLKATVPWNSPAAKAIYEYRARLDSVKGNPSDNPSYRDDIRRIREEFDASPASKEIRKLESRVNAVYGQFNYTRMNYLDDGYGTNFYGGTQVRFKGPNGEEYDSRGIKWKKGKFE
jgi:hypothetical protein